jgi:DNA-binding MarR family transcriptional regulator
MESLCKIKDLFKKIHQFEQKLNEEYNVTINEAMIICSLSEAKKSSGEIATDTGISPSRTSRVLHSLEIKGFVKRSFDNYDKRKMMFVLEESGQKKDSEIKCMDVDIDFCL